mmetsp:Transcript_26657/g.79605  ORF Transcript_26657/g.79605 Transcript_26657/m.79605 type:complete len:204 (+) Transcript_26657:187-798(+)
MQYPRRLVRVVADSDLAGCDPGAAEHSACPSAIGDHHGQDAASVARVDFQNQCGSEWGDQYYLALRRGGDLLGGIVLHGVCRDSGGAQCAATTQGAWPGDESGATVLIIIAVVTLAGTALFLALRVWCYYHTRQEHASPPPAPAAQAVTVLGIRGVASGQVIDVPLATSGMPVQLPAARVVATVVGVPVPVAATPRGVEAREA